MKRKCVLFIHGIGPQQTGYSDSLWDILWKDEVPGEIHRYELLYYDIFEAMNEKTNIEEFTQEYGFSKILEALIRDKGFAERIDSGISNILEDTVSHVFYFLLCEDARNAILNKFKLSLLDMIEAATKDDIYPSDMEVTIVSHSLGTVVAYSGLNAVIGEEGVGLQDDVRIKNLFTLASPIALIKEVGQHTKLFELPNITKGIAKAKEWNPAKEIYESNVYYWYSCRHKRDPVASLVPLVGDFLDSRDEPPFVFDSVHRGNVHAFENYLEQMREFIVRKI